jgi:hypothetical protein
MARLRSALIRLKIEALTCHHAGIVARRARSANVGPYGVDRACGRYPHFSHQRGAAIAAATHASQAVVDIGAGDQIKVGLAL